MFKRNIIILLLWVNINPVFSENKTYIQLYPDSIQNIIYKDSTLDLNISNIYLKILEYNILEPKIVLYQALHESGNFKSKYFKINNNLFGFIVNSALFGLSYYLIINSLNYISN
jgi:uncharacterized FlgJ-related protein